MELTGGFGADYTSRRRARRVMRQAVESAAWAGAWRPCAACRRATRNVVPRSSSRAAHAGCPWRLQGREDVPAYVQRYLAGEIDVDSFVSHKLTLDEVNRGFELMEAGDGIRSVIDFA